MCTAWRTCRPIDSPAPAREHRPGAIPALREPDPRRAVTLANRITRTAHGTGYTVDGKVTERLIAYHEARARGGVGSLFLETSGVPPTSPGPLRAFRDDAVAPLLMPRAIATGYRAGEAVLA